MNAMFCPRCGAGEQKAESYCRRCGEWLPDLDAARQHGIFRKRTREEKMGKMRILEVVSAALACTSAAIIFSALSGGDPSLLNLAGICCLVIAVYQVVNFYFGYTLQPKSKRNRTIQEDREIEERADDLRPALDANHESFIKVATVTENTTELLRPTREDNQHRESES